MKTTFALLELLEDRIAPAGVVTITYVEATGALTLDGDGSANSISILPTSATTHRIEAIDTTTLDGGLSFLDLGKVTSLVINGGSGDDTFNIFDLAGLKSFTFDGGADVDTLNVTDVTIKGQMTIQGGDGVDLVIFDGNSTTITGNLEVNDSADGISTVFNSQKAVIGGSLIFSATTGPVIMGSSGTGKISIAKGIDFESGAGGAGISFGSLGGTTIGKLATGESILFTGGNGGDVVQFAAGNITLAGGIKMTGGAGADLITAFNTRGFLKIGKLASGQSILFDGGDGADAINLTSSLTTASNGIEFAGGINDNSITLGSANGKVLLGKLPTGQSVKFTGGVDADALAVDASSVAFSGAIDFAGSDGVNAVAFTAANGIFKLGKLATGESIKYTGGSGTDTISTTSADLTMSGGIDFAGGSDTSSILLGGSNGKLKLGKIATGQSLKYVGSVDDDSFTTNVAAFNAAGGLEFVGGNGANAIAVNGTSGTVTIGKLSTGQSVLYTGGTGTDSFTSNQANITLTGGIEFAGGDGAGTIDIDKGGILRIGAITTGQSIKFTGGSGIDNLFLGGSVVALKGSAEMDGGANNDTIDLDGSAITIGKTAAGISLFLDGDDGNDVISLEDTATLAGSITLNGGLGNDQLTLAVMQQLVVKGPVTLDGGADNDTLTVAAFSLQLGSTLTVEGGDGRDIVAFTANGTITGDVNIDLGISTAGNQSTTFQSASERIFGLTMKSGLIVASSAAAANSEKLVLLNLSVAKALTATFGAGNSAVTIDNLLAKDILTINTGDGTNTVNFERSSLFGNSVITKLATIISGIGNDSVLIGNPTPTPNGGVADSSRVRFLAGLNANGGAGSDTFNSIETENDFPTVAAVLTSYEVLVT